jgi:hypothetical protein
MSDKDGAAIENASEVIERFGGIRPMAKKIEVAVTTIQGWKKRDVIPGARRDLVVEAASRYNVDLSDILNGTPGDQGIANENRQGTGAHVPRSLPQAPAAESTAPPVQAPPVIRAESPARVRDAQHDTGAEILAGLDQKLLEVEKRAVRKSMRVDVLVIFVVACAFAAFTAWLKPWSLQQDVQNETQLTGLQDDVSTLRGDVDAIKAEQSFLSTLIPKDLDQRIAALQDQAEKTQERLGTVMQKAGEAGSALIDKNAGTLQDRVETLQDTLDFDHAPQLAALLARFQGLSGTPDGQGQLDRAIAELSALASSFDNSRGQFDMALQTARTQSTALGQTFEGVPAEDLKAAAMLLAMSQFRESLNRDNASFDEDLQLLENLVGDENAELTQALETLAPHARSGVLTPEGLSKEFRTFAGEAVVASLQGEDVSLTDRAKARLNELLKVEKDGELITGTPTQAKLSAAEKMLDAGDIEGAIGTVETLEGPAAAVTAPWLEKARVTLLAQKMQTILSRGIRGVALGGGLNASGTQLIQDEETGINILRPVTP